MLQLIAILFNLFMALSPVWAIWYLIDYFKYDKDGWEIEKWWTKIRF